MKDAFYRFFWVEHPVGMILAILCITLGFRFSKQSAYSKTFSYFLVALILIMLSIPWPFRGEIIGRPLFPGGH